MGDEYASSKPKVLSVFRYMGLFDERDVLYNTSLITQLLGQDQKRLAKMIMLHAENCVLASPCRGRSERGTLS